MIYDNRSLITIYTPFLKEVIHNLFLLAPIYHSHTTIFSKVNTQFILSYSTLLGLFLVLFIIYFFIFIFISIFPYLFLYLFIFEGIFIFSQFYPFGAFVISLVFFLRFFRQMNLSSLDIST